MRQQTSSVIGILLIASLLLACPAARAQSGAVGDDFGHGADDSEFIMTFLGRGRIVTLPADIKRIALVDESVVRVNILGKREVLLHGLKLGQTSLFVWFDDGRRRHYALRVGSDLTLLLLALDEIGPSIKAEESADGRTVLLYGDVADAELAREAELRTETILAGKGREKPTILNLLRYPQGTGAPSADSRLTQALKTIDPRIKVRRIQVGDTTDSKADSYVLEGRVSTISDLTRAVTLAERQLGGAGGVVKAPDDTRVRTRRSQSFHGSSSGSGTQALNASDPIPNGIAAQVARGLVIASESGRVISFLEVDNIEQILVSIRALEIDRGKARSMGINYRVDGKHFSIGNYTGPQGKGFSLTRGEAASVSGLTDGNLVGAYVSSSVDILSAIDFLESGAVARSVAEPNVLTLTGEEATVLVGGEVPIPTTSIAEVAAVQGFTFQTFGVRLDIRPTVGLNDIITLEVAPSIVRPDEGLGVDGVPGFQVQSVQTTARVQEGESLVLGGLLTYRETVSERKLPFFGDLPIFSALFKWKKNGREERELLFVITPRIMPTEQDNLPEEPPPMDFRDAAVGKSLEPQTLTEDGLPSSWLVIEPPDAQGATQSAPATPQSDRRETPGSLETEVQEHKAIAEEIQPEAAVEETPDRRSEQRLTRILGQWRDINSCGVDGGRFYAANGKMFCGVYRGRLLLRLADSVSRDAFERSAAGPLNVLGWKLRGWVVLDGEAFDTDTELESWLRKAVEPTDRGSST